MRNLFLMTLLTACMTTFSGCAELNTLMYGPSVYYLDPEPRSGGCRGSDSVCEELDAYQNQLYDAVHSRRITWAQLVNMYYAKQDELSGRSTDMTLEMRSYQRVLAEQMDRKQITEAQWVYLLDKKAGELNARTATVRNSQPRSSNCTTTNTGTSSSPIYTTNCN